MTNIYYKSILLAEDDEDDCMLFKEALEALPISLDLTIVHDGVTLMNLLNQESLELPDVLFLDIKMPRKNGFECLSEIRSKERFNKLCVIIFSSYNAPEMAEQLYKKGAQFYVRKPDDVLEYKKVIYQALRLKHTNL